MSDSTSAVKQPSGKSKSGRFRATWTTWKQPRHGSYLCVEKHPAHVPTLSTRIGARPQKDIGEGLQQLFPVCGLDWMRHRHPPAPQFLNTLQLSWLGHSSTLLTFHQRDANVHKSTTILIDPVFEDKLHGGGFLMDSPRRIRPPSCSVGAIPHVDLVLISHDHYDHLSVPTIQQLERRRLPPTYVGGLGLREFLAKHLRRPKEVHERVIELDWWDCQIFSARMISVTFTPAQHWCRRNLRDARRRLWGGFIISEVGYESPRKVYFSGDTSFVPELFHEVAMRAGPMDFAVLPVSSVFDEGTDQESVLLTPLQLVSAHEILQCRQTVAVHHSTYVVGRPSLDVLERVITSISDAVSERLAQPLSCVALFHGASVGLSSDRSCYTFSHRPRTTVPLDEVFNSDQLQENVPLYSLREAEPSSGPQELVLSQPLLPPLSLSQRHADIVLVSEDAASVRPLSIQLAHMLARSTPVTTPSSSTASLRAEAEDAVSGSKDVHVRVPSRVFRQPQSDGSRYSRRRRSSVTVGVYDTSDYRRRLPSIGNEELGVHKTAGVLHMGQAEDSVLIDIPIFNDDQDNVTQLTSVHGEENV